MVGGELAAEGGVEEATGVVDVAFGLLFFEGADGVFHRFLGGGGTFLVNELFQRLLNGLVGNDAGVAIDLMAELLQKRVEMTNSCFVNV